MVRLVKLLFLAIFVFLSACKKEAEKTVVKEKNKKAEVTDFVDADASPEEKKYLEAARPIIVALSKRNYQEFYNNLSVYAKYSMSLNQFIPENDDAKFEANEKNPLKKVTYEQFVEQMKKVEAQYGVPHKPERLYVQSLDPKILSRKGTEQTDGVDSMLAIGAMPDLIPFDLRRASLRGQIVTKLSAEEMAKIAKEEEMTVEELEKNEDFKPYFTIKLVLIEVSGVLKIGYFEFLPPSMFD